MVVSDPGLSNCSFGFDGNKYAVEPYHKRLSSAQMDDIYLDLNSAWTKEEYNAVLELAEGKNVFVCLNKIVQVNASNKQEVWKDLKSLQFSLFPLYKIVNPARSLIVTKSSLYSPNVDDLSETGFMQQTKQFLEKNSKIKLFNIGKNLTPYL